METVNLFCVVGLLLVLNCVVPGYSLERNAYYHKEILGQDERYLLEWFVDWPTSQIYFNVTVRTHGYVALGLSRKGKMSGADIVIGGVLPNGQPYFSDRHAISSQLPVEDPSQDWHLHEALETDSFTFLSFSRSLETCDFEHDLVINRDVIGLLWAFGERDEEIEYHFQNRGVFWVYLLDADLAPREINNKEIDIIGNDFRGWKIWRIDDQQDVPAVDTTYLCSIHRSPVDRKQHIVGLRTVLPTQLETTHIHHFLLHRCIPPVGQSAESLFENVIGLKEECYILTQPTGRIPTQYCTELMHVWGVGGRPIFFPEHVGLPLLPNEYLMMQVHYDNPNLTANVRLNHALEVYYTDKLRQYDGGILAVGHNEPSPVSLMIPPNSIHHEIYGHCAPGCLQSMLPPTGIHIVAAMMHTHTTGSGTRILHFRHNHELPWITYDNNYNFNYQQVRVLPQERTVLPGDSLIYRCTYQNSIRPGNVTMGGYSSSHEMCSSLLWYYPKIPGRTLCRSEIQSPEYLNFLQIYNTTWSNQQLEEVVTLPQHNEGLTVSQVGNQRMDWSLENRNLLQSYHRYLPQVTGCPSVFSGQPNYQFESVYPRNSEPYELPSSCSSRSSSLSTTSHLHNFY